MDYDDPPSMFLSPEISALPSLEETWSMEPRAPYQGIAGDENVPVLQISDYEDFPLPFNLEDLLDAGPMTIENLLDIPSSDPVISSELLDKLDKQMPTEPDDVAFCGEALHTQPSNFPLGINLFVDPPVQFSYRTLSYPNSDSLEFDPSPCLASPGVGPIINQTQPPPVSMPIPPLFLPTSQMHWPTPSFNSFEEQIQLEMPVRPRNTINEQNISAKRAKEEEMGIKHKMQPLTKGNYQQQEKMMHFLPLKSSMIKQEVVLLKQEKPMMGMFQPQIIPQNLKAGLLKREPRIFEEDLEGVADLKKDMMMIKQEESWHEQLLKQQSRFFAAPPLLEQVKGERRALIGKLVKDFTVKINKEEQMDHKDVKMAQPEKSVRAQDPKTSSVQIQRSPQQRPESGYLGSNSGSPSQIPTTHSQEKSGGKPVYGSPLSFHPHPFPANAQLFFPPPVPTFPADDSAFPAIVPNIPPRVKVKTEPNSQSVLREAILRGGLYEHFEQSPPGQERAYSENAESTIKEEKVTVGRKKKTKGKMEYQCDQCHKRFSQLSNLKMHVRTHTQVRPYCCHMDNKYGQPCGKTFKQLVHLQKHQLIHSNLKPFACTYCEKKFTSTSNLRTHERVHKMEKPYTCNMCEDRFTQNVHLKQHMVRVHG